MTNIESSGLIGQRNKRIKKLQDLQLLGVNPFPAKSRRTHSIAQILQSFNTFKDKSVTIVGRIVVFRKLGGLVFLKIKDQTGSIQIIINKRELKALDLEKQILGFKELRLLDISDFIQITGKATFSKTNEHSILAKEIKILTKTIRPHPGQLSNIEEGLRKRYLEISLNNEVKARFERRALFWDAHREFLKKSGFLEMNIPVLEHTTGGADAKPFVTHMDALNTDFFLRISQELYLKRLIGAGYEKVFEIGPRFRNEGIDDEHLPEHIAMEMYWAYADYLEGIEFVQEMFTFVYQKVYNKLEFNIRSFTVDLAKEWVKLDFSELIQKHYNINIFKTSLDELKNALRKGNILFDETININRGIDALWKSIRKTIGGPAFVINEPTFLSPLAKARDEKPELTQRFHPIIAGSELGNAYSELNNPLDQLQRFIDQQKMRDSGDDEAQMLDIDFVEMLEYGMPPTFGYGHSERNFWFFENVPARQGVPFPQMKYQVSEVTKKIYKDIDLEENTKKKGFLPPF